MGLASDLDLNFANFLLMETRGSRYYRDDEESTWEVDAFTFSDGLLIVTGQIDLIQRPCRYRVNAAAIYKARGQRPELMEQAELETFVRGPAAHLLYQFVKEELRRLAGALGDESLPPVSPPEVTLLRSGSEGWHLRIANVDKEQSEGASDRVANESPDD